MWEKFEPKQDTPKKTPDTQKQNQEKIVAKQKEVKEVIKETQNELKTLKTDVEKTTVANEIVSSIVEQKDTLEPDQKGIQEIRELIKNKEYGKAFSKALDVISKLFKFKLQSGFDHLQPLEWKMQLEQLIKENNTEKITQYIKEYETSLWSKISINDKSDISYLLSKCKDALYDIAKKKEWKDPKETTKYEYFTNAITKNWTESPVWKVLLFNWWDFSYSTEKKLFDKAVQSASGSWREHTAIISGYNKETWEITITHSTTKWVHTSTLKEYFTFANTKVDVIALNIPDDKKQSVVNYVEQQKWKKYDIKWALTDVVSQKTKSDGSSYYCSELIYKWLQAAWESIPEDMIYPWQILNVLKPDYVTSIQTSEVK